jgi:hypothetical protein
MEASSTSTTLNTPRPALGKPRLQLGGGGLQDLARQLLVLDRACH